MKKTIALTLLALTLSIAVLCTGSVWAARALCEGGSTQTILRGDAKAAEGITVSGKVSYNFGRHLWWDITTRCGAAATDIITETALHYSEARQNNYRYSSSPVTLFISAGWGISGGLEECASEEEFEQSYPGLTVRPVPDVAARTAPGETHTEWVDLADYYDTYPITLDYAPPPGVGYTYDDTDEGSPQPGAACQSLFAVPVQKGTMVCITVEKGTDGKMVRADSSPWHESAYEDDLYGENYGPNENGALPDIGVGAPGSTGVPTESVQIPSISSVSAFLGNSFYFTFADDSNEGGLPDGMAGLYATPFSEDNVICRSETRAVLALPSGAYPVAMEADEENGLLYVLTRGLGGTALTLWQVRAADGEVLQKCTTSCREDMSYMSGLTRGDSWLAAWDYNGNFVLFTADAAGQLSAWTPAALTQDVPAFADTEEHWSDWRLIAFAFDGERLAVALPRSDTGCAERYLAVYGSEGLRFAGQLIPDLDAGADTLTQNIQTEMLTITME